MINDEYYNNLLTSLTEKYKFYKKLLEEEFYNIYVISDMHFSDTNILSYRNQCKKIKYKFTNVGEMNRIIIHNILETIPDNSTLYILGDVGECSLLTYLTNIKLVFILGNHDKEINTHIKTKDTPLETLNRVIIDNDLDATIINEEDMKEVINDKNEKVKAFNLYNDFLYLSHESIFYNSTYGINLHGHLHPGPNNEFNIKDIKKYKDGGRHYNCTVDYNDFKPINLYEIFEKMEITLEDIIKAIPYKE